jgi:hypothetical protein
VLTEKSKLDFGVLSLRPRMLISLVDMILFLGGEPIEILWKLEFAALGAATKASTKGAQSLATSDEIKVILEIVERVEGFCDRLKFQDAKGRIDLFKLFLQKEINCYYTVVERELEGIKFAINTEIENRKILLLSKEEAELFNQEKLFGDAVHKAFINPELRCEINEAGTCLASGLNTAAIFHLMRVAEFGLRKLAKPFAIKLPHKIEFATWGKVLDAIQHELDKKGVRRSAAKEKKLQRYSALLLEIKAFQHLWRNPVSHLRGRYDEQQANSAFNHVRRFMENLID